MLPDTRCDRRRFLAQTGSALLASVTGYAEEIPVGSSAELPVKSVATGATVRLFLCGDVMTGRGIDQVMRHPGDPQLHEGYVKSARTYVELAERVSGPIPRGVAPDYVWGGALGELDRARPDARIVNLETAVTTANDPWIGKGIHYRMHPANVGCLSAAKIDCCMLANNHVLDWGYDGLEETLATLHAAGIRTAGAGGNETEARAPAVIELRQSAVAPTTDVAPRPTARVLVFACGSPSAGVPLEWAATRSRAGVSLLDESDPACIEQVARAVRAVKRAGDLAIVSIHWGANWGYDVSREQQRVAHGLIDEAGIDVVYGHSSHHPRPFEVYGGKLILYGCGDFLNDYEGIGGHEAVRPELGLMYLPELEVSSGRLRRLTLVPTRVREFRVNRASEDEAEWLCGMLEREGRAFGTRVRHNAEGNLVWADG
jgi:poly-gamma-glutamate synthesis protein (capsule biosynthesis protein)